jgi:hypothetical protein
MKYEDYAMNEFRAAGWVDADGKWGDEWQEAICNHVLDLLKVFGDEGHSGTTAPYAVNLFKDLALFKPIVPLTGEDWEWRECDGILQNTRLGSVFKGDLFDGKAYRTDGRIFWEWCQADDGRMYKSHYSSRDSFVPIEFPYTPMTEYVFVPSSQFPDEIVKE